MNDALCGGWNVAVFLCHVIGVDKWSCDVVDLRREENVCAS